MISLTYKAGETDPEIQAWLDKCSEALSAILEPQREHTEHDLLIHGTARIYVPDGKVVDYD